MTHFKLLFPFLFGLISCGQSFKRKNPGNDTIPKTVYSNTNKTMNNLHEIWAIYSHQDSIYHVKRLISDSGSLSLLNYDINTSQPENAIQTFIEKKSILNFDTAKKIKSENAKYNWKSYKTPKQTLFVQIEPSAFKNEMDALNRRQEIEEKIETALKLNDNGDWIAGDLGPGGANMLFEVKNIDEAIPVILGVLSNEGFESKTIIGRRLNTAKDDWFYEVIYPLNFTGQFSTM